MSSPGGISGRCSPISAATCTRKGIRFWLTPSARKSSWSRPPWDSQGGLLQLDFLADGVSQNLMPFLVQVAAEIGEQRPEIPPGEDILHGNMIGPRAH